MVFFLIPVVGPLAWESGIGNGPPESPGIDRESGIDRSICRGSIGTRGSALKRPIQNGESTLKRPHESGIHSKTHWESGIQHLKIPTSRAHCGGESTVVIGNRGLWCHTFFNILRLDPHEDMCGY